MNTGSLYRLPSRFRYHSIILLIILGGWFSNSLTAVAGPGAGRSGQPQETKKNPQGKSQNKSSAKKTSATKTASSDQNVKAPAPPAARPCDTVRLQKRIDSLLKAINTLTNVSASQLNELNTAKEKLKSADSLQTVCRKTCTCCDSIFSKLSKPPAKPAPPKKTTDFTKIVTLADRVNFNGADYDIYATDVQAGDVVFYWRDKRSQNYGSIYALREELKSRRETLVFATNGRMYTETHEPVGLYVEKGKEIHPVNLDFGGGNFYMNFGDEGASNGVFYIDKAKHTGICKANEYGKTVKSAEYATQSGPLLLYKGKINPNFTEGSSNLKYRSGVGILSPTKMVFAISNKPVNFFDFAKLFRDYFKCSNALYLDGEISIMYIPELKRLEDGGEFGVIIGISK